MNGSTSLRKMTASAKSCFFIKEKKKLKKIFLSKTTGNIPDKKRNAPLKTVQLSGRSQVIGQFSLYQCKGMSGTAALHIFCNQASKMY